MTILKAAVITFVGLGFLAFIILTYFWICVVRVMNPDHSRAFDRHARMSRESDDSRN